MHQPNYSSLKCSHSDPLEFPYKGLVYPKNSSHFMPHFQFYTQFWGKLWFFMRKKLNHATLQVISWQRKWEAKQSSKVRHMSFIYVLDLR